MKSKKYYRVLYLYDRLKSGELVKAFETANLFDVDGRTIQRDISDIRCYLADDFALHGHSDETIIYSRSSGGYMMTKIA